MRGSRFTDEQIIGVLRRGRRRSFNGRSVPSPWDFTRDLLQSRNSKLRADSLHGGSLVWID